MTKDNMGELAERPYGAGHLRFACPGDEQQSSTPWLLRFSDPDIPDQVFIGDTAEQDAWKAWNRFAPAYNCYLFRIAALESIPQAGMRERLEAAIDDEIARCPPEHDRTTFGQGVFAGIERARAAVRSALSPMDEGVGQ